MKHHIVIILLSLLFTKSSSAQFVGINIANPNVDLHINGNAASNKRIQFTNSGTGTTLLDGALLGISGTGDAYFLQNEAQHLWFGTSGNERIRIMANGLVGINTASPLFNFHVKDVNNSGIPIWTESSNATESTIYSNSLNATAVVGFGYARQNISRAYSGINGSNDWFMSVAGFTSALYVKSSNNYVGFGTFSPTDKIHIMGAAGNDERVKIEVPTTAGSGGFIARGNLGVLDVMGLVKYNSAASGAINGVPLAGLSLLYAGSQAKGMLINVSTENALNLATNNTLRMTITGVGNVGIGTSTPTRALEVNGLVRFGAAGTTITNVIKQTSTADLPIIPAGTTFTQTFIVTGAAFNSTAAVSPQAYPGNGLIIAYSRVSAPNIVEVAFYNATASDIDPASMNFDITVIQ